MELTENCQNCEMLEKKKASKKAIIFLQFYEVMSALIQKELNNTSYLKVLK